MSYDSLVRRIPRRMFFVMLALVAVVGFAVSSQARASQPRDDDRASQVRNVESPINIAVLIQDDLISQVGNELGVTADFIRSLPKGSRVMVGYITTGTLQVRQPFTTDLASAASSLRIPLATTAASPYNPYVEVIEALRQFNSSWQNQNVVLLVSDGLDTSRGFDVTTAANTVDLLRATREANTRNVNVYSFYAPSVGLTSHNRLAASYGQSSLNRISNETGGKAFFQGTTGFVTFDPYFAELRRALNRRT